MTAALLLLIAADARPNVVFLMADDLATSAVGCYGNPHVRTPHINALAAEGLTFDRHYVTTAICMASRASVLTGLLEYRHGCNFHSGPLREADWAASYPVRLRAAGYRTAFAGKFGLTVGGTRPEKGRLPAEDFDAWAGGPGQTSYKSAKNPALARYADEFPHASRAYGAWAADFVRDAAGGPFCLSVSFKAPHRPVTPDAAYAGWYAGATFPKPANYGRDVAGRLPAQAKSGRQWPRFVEWGYADGYDGAMADYFRLVAGVDAAVGMIRAAIDEAGVKGRTLVVFTSDNGYFCGSHGLGSKVLPYEESARVPLVVYDPAAPGGGRRTDALTAGADFAATFLDYAGLEADAGDGRSLRPVIEGRDGRGRETVPLIDAWSPAAARSLAVVRREGGAVRKTVRWSGLGGAEESFDLSADPHELRPTPPTDADRAAVDAVLDDWETRGVGSYRADAAALRAAVGE